MNDLIFFNDSGDSLNFTYDPINDKYTSTLNFDANSSDTFKTIGLYMFQAVDSIELDSIDNDINLQKFQLFNENRFTFTGNSYFTQSVTDIQSVNNNSLFYSKWIYGLNFEVIFPIGSGIKFDFPIFEFTTNITYMVVSSKKNAIMVVSTTDNVTYNNMYSGVTFSNISISGLNSIGIYDYIRDNVSQLSTWNEQKFYNKLYDNKKLTYLNTKTQSVLTVLNSNLVDRAYYKYNISSLTYTQSNDLFVNLTLKTDLPTVYIGGLNIISSSNRIYFSNTVPSILTSGTQFVISNSILNANTITIDSISNFTGNVVTTYYPLDSQVIYNNIIYQCIQSYTQSLTASIVPNDGAGYWTSSISYLPVSSLVNETLSNASIHLTTNILTYSQSFTNSSVVTMAMFAQRYVSNFEAFNVNLYYDDVAETLNADLVYSSNYAQVDFLIGTQSITNVDNIVEKVIETKEILTSFIDNNISSNYSYYMVVDLIDDFGIKVLINGQVYQEPTEYIYNGLNVDQIKTIYRTLRNFLFNNFLNLSSIGIGMELHTTNFIYEFGFFKDTVLFTSQYPNVPLSITIQMGSLSSYYIKHSLVSFNDVGSYLNININGVDYGQKISSFGTQSFFVPDINTALINWTNTYSAILYGYGVLVNSVRNNLYFNISDPTTRLTYAIRTNKLPTPGIDQYMIQNYISGSLGSLVAGNEVILSATSSQNFEDSGFSTGMIAAVNNTLYPYDNQEYNILYVNDNKLGLSYQGPFWDTTGRQCSVSSFGVMSFSPLAYSTSPCPSPTSSGGEFDVQQFSSGFAISFILSNNYTALTINSDVNLNDILYIDEYDKIYVFGSDVSVIDAKSFVVSTVIPLGITSSVKITYNNYNKYIYCLTNSEVIIIDPINNVVSSIVYIGVCNDILINQKNGDVYISGNNSVKIYKYNNFGIYPDVILNITSANKMEYNIVDNYIYVVGNYLYVINTVSRSVYTQFIITSLDNNYIYSEPINGSIYVWGDMLYKITNNIVDGISYLNNIGYNDLIYDNLSGDMYLSQESGTNFIKFGLNDAIEYTQNFGFGNIVVNQFDGNIYMLSSVGRINVINPNNGMVVYTINIGFNASKIIYNPIRNSVVCMGMSGSLYELGVVLNSIITQSPTSSSPSSLSDGLFGVLSEDYQPRENIWLKTRQYLRGPRENYSDDVAVQYIWKFENDQVPDIFMYDISGNQLPTGTSYSYVGTKPLTYPVLNDKPNMDMTKLSDSSVQQTVFTEIVNTLEYLDDPNDISILPTPMQVFLGYNSPNEGYESSILKMYSRENVTFTLAYNISSNNEIILTNYGTYGVIQMNQNSLDSFVYNRDDTKRGLKVGQLLQLTLTDITNSNNKYVSYNNGLISKVRSVFNTQIVIDYLQDNGVTASITNESNIVSNYPSVGLTTYLSIGFNVIDKEMVSITLYGQTEIEDIRYKIELNNSGHNINPSDAYIFKTYDIDEQGIDWRFLNKKRKEMIIVRSDIFPYVGSYKAIINAINYFGYNDLVLYEYYRNINIQSPDFFKLFKVEISDIFDNSISGWTPEDFLKHTMPNPNFEETNLFNLTYLITDKQGNNVLLYSLQDVLIKLQGLKTWLETKVVPLTHRILDITGRTDFVGGNYLTHKSFSVKSFRIDDEMTPIDFNINEAYLMPVNSGSTVYNVVIDFVASKIGVLPTNFSVLIRTYKTYLEWNPFTIYNIGDEVTYYGIIYMSIINTNQLIDPRQYDSLPDWSADTEYFDGQIINYNRYAYEYLGTQSSFLQFGTASVPTPAQTNIWLNISNWVQQDLVPVQTITEYRYVDNVTYSTISSNILFYTSSVVPDYLIPSPSYNFSVDSNIDPFIVVEVTSENGYGVSYTSKKNYEIRGLNDLYAGITNIESIGPFIPIVPVINHI